MPAASSRFTAPGRRTARPSPTSFGGSTSSRSEFRTARRKQRLAAELRNALIFELGGGAAGGPPTHRLTLNLQSIRQQVIVDITTSRPDVEQAGINAEYTLTEIGSGKVVVTGQTFSRVSYDNPGQEQRFARARGRRDAEHRAAKVIAENIRARLASYFIAGT